MNRNTHKVLRTIECITDFRFVLIAKRQISISRLTGCLRRLFFYFRSSFCTLSCFFIRSATTGKEVIQSLNQSCIILFTFIRSLTNSINILFDCIEAVKQDIDQLGICFHISITDFLEDILHVMCQMLELLKAHCSCHPL